MTNTCRYGVCVKSIFPLFEVSFLIKLPHLIEAPYLVEMPYLMETHCEWVSGVFECELSHSHTVAYGAPNCNIPLTIVQIKDHWKLPLCLLAIMR